MYTLYNHPSGEEPRQLSLGSYGRVFQSHRDNLSRVIHYYRRASYATNSDHLLVQILQILPDGEGLELNQYRDKIEDYTDELVRAFNLTSPIHVGKITDDSVFLGSGVTELILGISQPFSVGEFKNRWMDASPVRFYRHPVYDFNFEVPDGKDKGVSEGLTVVNIDIPLLACQYRLWRERERRVNPNQQHTPMQFVYRHPLANALGSLADVALLNRFRRLFFGQPMENLPHQHPFYLNTLFDKTNEGLVDILHRYLDTRLSFGEVLESIEPLSKSSLQEVVAFPSMPFTRQVKWALSLTRFPLIQMLLLWDERTGGRQNRKDINRVKRSVRQLRADSSLSSFDNDHVYEIIDRELENDIKNYLR